MSFLGEFKKFAMRGNVVDMAVGIILGSAFGAIVNSLVNDVIMPPIGLLLGNVDFSQLSLTLRPAVEGQAAVVINYGTFINTIVSFLVIAFSVFLMVKTINKLESKKAEEPAPVKAPELSTEEKLLTEIRDLLKKDSLK